MNFKEWFENSEFPFLTGLSNYILNSAKFGKGTGSYLAFSLPSSFDHFLAVQRPSGVVAPLSQTIAAHFIPLGDSLKEGFSSAAGLTKGQIAYKTAVNQKLIKPYGNSGEIENFSDYLNTSIAKVSTNMGQIFEIEIFKYLVIAGKLSPVGDFDLSEANRRVKPHIAKMSTIVPANYLKKILELIRGYAAKTGQQMIAKVFNSMELRNSCKGRINQVEFTGGIAANEISDIKIGCGANAMGFSVKFTTEAKTGYRRLNFSDVYVFLGGTNPEGHLDAIKNIKTDFDSAKNYMIEVLAKLAKNNVKTSSDFVSVLNNILTKGEFNFPAVTNYLNGTGGAAWSPAIEKQFQTSDKSATPLSPLPGAKVKVTITNTYVKLSYIPHGNTKGGTFITFEPKLRARQPEFDFGDESDKPYRIEAHVDVKINNLGSG